ncbi:MAG: polyhydroxybutyrate depolymerase [Paracoccaceae bacterium]
MRISVLGFSVVLGGLLGAVSPTFACGPDTDCELGNRHYRISSVENAPNGAIVFAHGYRGSAAGMMRNMNLRNMVDEMGLAFITVKSLRDDWAIPNAPSDLNSDGESEFAYFEDVLKDVEKRFGLDRSQVMMTGFSAGGMMVWELACNRPNLFAGFAPIAGTFWKGPPQTCVAPANIVHIHGTSDRTVPLTGRRIGRTKQGSVPDTLEMYRDFGSFADVERVAVQSMECQREANADGRVLEFCTHPGGHSFSRSYLKYAWTRLENAGAFQ